MCLLMAMECAATKGNTRGGSLQSRRSNVHIVGPTWRGPQEGQGCPNTCGPLRTAYPGKSIAKEITPGTEPEVELPDAEADKSKKKKRKKRRRGGYRSATPEVDRRRRRRRPPTEDESDDHRPPAKRRGGEKASDMVWIQVPRASLRAS